MNSFNTKTTLESGSKNYTIYSFKALEEQGYKVSRLPYSLRVLLENLLRTEGQGSVNKPDIENLLNWAPKADPQHEIAFSPARVLLQDFTGVPCVVDLAAMRDAMKNLGGDPNKINPLQPVELVIDHSVQVDAYGSEAALLINRDLEFERNNERYQFLKWGQSALENFKVVPPNTGICHQVNLEYLARGVFVNEKTGEAYPDTLVGTDSHTTMINGLGVLGWGVGGIEAEAAMLGQPVSMLIPQVIGFKLSGKLREGTTSTDLVLRVTEMLRKKGVVGKFVEFYGAGALSLPLADRATIGNMAPEYGATCGIFPIDEVTLKYLRLTGRPEWQVKLVENYTKAQGIFATPDSPEAEYTDTLELDLDTVEPSVSGPKRPQDRVALSQARASLHNAFPQLASGGGAAVATQANELTNASVVIAAITSCTNTSNPSVMVAAGLVARNAVKRGLQPKEWVKTSLAPGSKVVTEYLEKSKLLDDLNQIGFNVVGYGCTTCIGNSGPLPEWVSKKVQEDDLVVCSVLSGNRNFEGRIQQDIKANYLMSPPLVVAYALAGTMEIDLQNDPLGKDRDGNDVYLKDIWPTQASVAEVIESSIDRDLFERSYTDVFKGDEKWAAIDAPSSDLFAWNGDSTYIKNPPYFAGMSKEAPSRVADLVGLRALAVLGDSITTDHISPAGAIKLNSPAGQYLVGRGVEPKMFNSYGARRGHDEVMVRGTFANVRLRNQLAPGTEGGFTTYLPTGEVTTIYDASVLYKQSGTPLIVIAGKEYGSGSSRDWAAKGTNLLGIKVVLAESFERIHRSNLVGMGILPLEFTGGDNRESLGLTGQETFDLVRFSEAMASGFADGKLLTMRATLADGSAKEFTVKVRIDTPQEILYYQNGGILQYVLRQLVNG
ncbi:MAG: aconitate hydratase 1 [Armatimonadetes bacterium 55-13]|nr:MAG: aconitate hydratase 1 [Armatimonadetes bacterium 55-13]